MLRHLICDGVATVSARVPVPVIGLVKTQRAGTGVYITAGDFLAFYLVGV